MREHNISRIQVHVAGICFATYWNNTYVLGLRRTDTREIFPGYWECSGGQVLYGETFEQAINRKINEETGLLLDQYYPFKTYHIKTVTETIPGIRYICHTKLQTIRRQYNQHVDARWFPVSEIGKPNWIPGLKDDIETAIKLEYR